MNKDEDIKYSAENNLGQKYRDDNQCDSWVEKVLKEAGIDPSKFLAGDADSNDVAAHIANAIEKGIASDNPGEGSWSIVLMDKGKTKKHTPHAGLLYVDSKGKATFYDMSKNNSGSLSRRQNYGSVSLFQGDYGYRRFTYVGVH